MFLETRLTNERIRSQTDAGHWRGRVLRDYLVRHVQVAPDSVAIAASERGPALSYRALLERADRLALALLAHGIGPNDVVSVQLPNWPEFALLLLAIERIGAIMNPLTPILRERDLTRMLEIGGARALFVPGTFRGFDYARMAVELAAQIPSIRLVVVVDASAPSGAMSWSEFEGDPHKPIDARDKVWLDRLRPDANRVTELAFTSGTTGTPRGVLHTHNTAICTVGSTLHRQGLDGSSVIHVATPVGHNAGYFYGCGSRCRQARPWSCRTCGTPSKWCAWSNGNG
jgi:cyclohexanecarboxylate-CoA ligase